MDMQRILNRGSNSDDDAEEEEDERSQEVEVQAANDADGSLNSLTNSEQRHDEILQLAPRLATLLAKVRRIGIACAALPTPAAANDAPSEGQPGSGSSMLLGAALREMVLNGFHACDARYFRGHRRGLGVRVAVGCSSTNSSSAGSSRTTTPSAVRVSVTDTGMGLTHGDLVNNLSAYDGNDHTLNQALDAALVAVQAAQEAGVEDVDAAKAHYGTAASAVRHLASALGFWASYLVSDHVTLCTKHVDDNVYLWELVLPRNDNGNGSSRPASGVIEIRKGAAALTRGQQLLEQTPPLGASTPEAIQAASANGFLMVPSSRSSGDNDKSSSSSKGSSGNSTKIRCEAQSVRQQEQGWLGPLGFPEGSTIHLVLREGHGDDPTREEATEEEARDSSRTSASSSTRTSTTTRIWSCALDEASVQKLVAGSGNDDGSDGNNGSSLAASATYPLLFWGNSSGLNPQSGSEAEEDSAENGSDDGNYSDGEVQDDRSAEHREAGPEEGGSLLLGGAAARAASVPTTMRERAVYIPLRLSYEDRKVLRLAEGALKASSYTDTVDSEDLANPRKAAKRKQRQAQEVCTLLSGLVVACDYENGRGLLEDKDFSEFRSFFRHVFETIRRYKIMNPEKLRSSYGKLIYLLQDAASEDMVELLGFNIVAPIKTVHSLLGKAKRLEMLDDPAIDTATQEILPDKSVPRPEIERMIKRKERAIEHLVERYSCRALPPDAVRQCCYSIGDNNSFLNSNRRPCDEMLELLDEYFSPSAVKVLSEESEDDDEDDNEDEGENGVPTSRATKHSYSLAIVSGTDGARLTHSHRRQWHFVRQSLLLWRAITHDMFRLWSLAEQDMFNSSYNSSQQQDGGGAGGGGSGGGAPYVLKDTGQGIQRVQPCPRTYRAMQSLLRHTQASVNGSWAGSSVIHMGDHNVPNALSFIDKYTQVPKILAPLVACLHQLEALCDDDDESVQDLINDAFGSMLHLKLDVLHDFFRSAFDGSGAENYYDAGSCIDGRLTSAWNWCNELPQKPYYFALKLVGFSGFDGEFDA